MSWPTPQEYNEAIQTLKLCFNDEELRSGTVRLNRFGIPRAVTGAFASVYCVTVGSTQYAVRCFLHEIPDQRIRYERLSASICKDELEYTVDFEFQDQGIRVNDEFFPIVKMPWVNGDSLDEYIKKHYADRQRMTELQTQFRAMVKSLGEVGFAHGDLQHGNIIVSEDGLRLVDYDGMFVPALSGFSSNELGHRNYQHPNRSKDHFGAYLDNFSAWVIDTSLTCLIEDSTLYQSLQTGDEALLLRRVDFVDPMKSPAFYAFEKHSIDKVQRASRLMRTVLSCLPFNVPPLSEDVPEACEQPRVLIAKLHAIEMNKTVEDWKLSAAISERESAEARIAAEASAQAAKPAKEQASLETALLSPATAHVVDTNDHTARKIPGWLDDITSAALVSAGTNSSEYDEPGGVGLTDPAETNPTINNGSSTKVPAVNEYVAALHDPKATLTPVLNEYTVSQTNGQPTNFGTENAVFHLSSNQANVALKFFVNSIAGLEVRQQGMQAALNRLPEAVSQYFLRQTFIATAVQIDGEWFPGATTNWQANGVSLDKFLATRKPDFDYTLLNRYRKMILALQTAGIAHGSLEPSNILYIKEPDNQLLLVDYDNFYAAETAACGPNRHNQIAVDYRHPRAQAADFGSHIDHFQSWLLDTILLCWSADRALWQTFLNQRGSLFFHQNDLSNPNGSELFRALIKNQQYEISERAGFLLSCLRLDPQDTPPLTPDGVPPSHS